MPVRAHARVCVSSLLSVLHSGCVVLLLFTPAVELCLPEQLSLETDARRIQTNVRSWLLRRNYRNMRDAARKLQAGVSPPLLPSGGRCLMLKLMPCVCVCARRFAFVCLCLYVVRAATRGMLARKNFEVHKHKAFAALVIQRATRSWLKTYAKTGRGEVGAGSHLKPVPEEDASVF